MLKLMARIPLFLATSRLRYRDVHCADCVEFSFCGTRDALRVFHISSEEMKFHLTIVNPAKRELEKFREIISKYNSLSLGL